MAQVEVQGSIVSGFGPWELQVDPKPEALSPKP